MRRRSARRSSASGPSRDPVPSAGFRTQRAPVTVPAEVLAALAALARARQAAAPVGQPFLVVVDGPAGSGKTTLADQLAPRVGDGSGGRAQVVHMDDLYEGWAAGPDG